ncbi:unnamed protein product [Rangifer tarandus platyrhynchus]|uniref:Uncharacterized protein n=2 Tax=Rangifer tarandus platyrhynchus TaxID=3082113 RepID=A0ABN8YNB7_RANTA|nr:unnamed protein product [Rangifer tarandus platyrhynchus]CAI9701533.1 unnamed protein product [Rangifer tarandus platyrhynchus]
MEVPGGACILALACVRRKEGRGQRGLPSPSPRPDPRLPEPWRQPAPFSGRARLPRSPGSARGGGRGLDDPGPQRPGLSRPLRQIAADRRAVSLESPPARRLPPDPITPRRVGPSGWDGAGGAGGATSSPPVLSEAWRRGPFFRSGSGGYPGTARPLGSCPQASRLAGVPGWQLWPGTTRPSRVVALHFRGQARSQGLKTQCVSLPDFG